MQARSIKDFLPHLKELADELIAPRSSQGENIQDSHLEYREEFHAAIEKALNPPIRENFHNRSLEDDFQRMSLMERRATIFDRYPSLELDKEEIQNWAPQRSVVMPEDISQNPVRDPEMHAKLSRLEKFLAALHHGFR